MNTLKERLESALADQSQNQLALAKAAKVAAPSVNDWLTGKTKELKAAPALRAAKFLKVRAWWLVFGEGPKEVDAQESRSDEEVLLADMDWRNLAHKAAEDWEPGLMRDRLLAFCDAIDAKYKQRSRALRERENSHGN